MRHARRAALLASLVVLPGCVEPRRAVLPSPESPMAPISLFEHAWRWTDDHGATARFADWKGRPVILAAIYTACTRTCPRTVHVLRKLAAQLELQQRDAVFVIVSLDPTTDTPDRLREFKRETALPDAWHLLRGSRDATDDVADLLDIHVLDTAPHIMHDARIAIFDPRGALIRRFACDELEGGAPIAMGLPPLSAR